MALVLVIEDDQATRDVIGDVLREHGHGVISVSEAEDGLELLGKLPISLVFLDLGLPGIGGQEFLARRRAGGFGSQAKIVVITAAGSRRTASLVKDLGASLTVVKPFNPDELVTIADALGSRGPTP